MKYMGSKNRIAKHILPIMLAEAEKNNITTWVEPFVGGANMIDKVPESYVRIGYDFNEYVIAMLQGLQSGELFPTKVTKEMYNFHRNNKNHNKAMTGWCGISASYSGKWFGGFADVVKTKVGVRDYQQESINNVLSQLPNISNVEFISGSYQSVQVHNFTNNAIIYCDPPYQGTTGYKDMFDSEEFFNWCRKMKTLGNVVFVSEYAAPDDFTEVWSKEVSSSLSANGKIGRSIKSVEKLFKV